MYMNMTLRWFGSNHDSVTLKYIRQIPDVKGVVSSLHDVPVGEAWDLEDVLKLKKQVEANGLKLLGIESVNIHEDIKIGLPSREKYIDNYIRSLENLGKAGVGMVCYNFMPIFDWTRTDLAYELEDGSTVLSYNEDIIKGLKPEDMFERIEKESSGFIMPGWEPNRKDEIMDLFQKYKGVTAEKLMENLKYFLDAIMPTCEKYKIKMAIHPDDPAWSVFGLPRIVTSEKALEEIASLNDSIYNGFTLCTGSLGSNLKNNLPEIIGNPKISDRIHFVHLRNMKFESDGVFHESSHLSSDGNFDMYEIVKALHDVGFNGIIRPDHGRMIWGEEARPGYGLYDRALGATYINGLWEAIKKNSKQI